MRAKAEKEQRAIQALQGCSWARALLDGARRQPNNEGLLFEVRFAYEIVRAGLTPTYEYKTEGKSSVDFRLEVDEVAWNIELVSFETSAAVRQATSAESHCGVTEEVMILGRPGDGLQTTKQCPESELLRTMDKLESKVATPEGRPIKFPLPQVGIVNVLLVDMRHYEGIGHPDRDHCRHIVDARQVQYPQNLMFHPDGSPILGLWQDDNARRPAQLARERLHLIGFVHEEVFSDDEIRQVTVLFGNPRLGLRGHFARYPLAWPAAIDADVPLRQTNSLWKNG